MSTHYEIFLRPLVDHVSAADVADDIGRAAGTTMRLVGAAPEVEYGGRTENTVVELFVGHEFEDEEDLSFSTHQYFVQFRDFDRNLDREKQTMSATYRALAALEKYDIFATLDLQVRADPHS